MRYQDALDMMRSNFGPGELADHLNDKFESKLRSEVSIKEAEEVMFWVAEQLTDEPDGNDDEGTEGTES